MAYRRSASAHPSPQQASQPSPPYRISAQGPERAALRSDLEQASILVDDDPDVAALLLDGVLRRAAAAWYAAHRLAPPDPSRLLADLEQRAAPLAWLLRLALRAPDVRARFVHLRSLVAAMGIDGVFGSHVYGHAAPVPEDSRDGPAIDQRPLRISEGWLSERWPDA